MIERFGLGGLISPLPKLNDEKMEEVIQLQVCHVLKYEGLGYVDADLGKRDYIFSLKCNLKSL